MEPLPCPRGRWLRGSCSVACCWAAGGPALALGPAPGRTGDLCRGLRQSGVRVQAARGQPGGGWLPRPPAVPYAHAVAYSSHVPGPPSCHCHNYYSHGRGTCACGDPPVSLGLYCRCYSLPGHGLPSAGLLKTAAIPIHHGPASCCGGCCQAVGSACSLTCGPDLGGGSSEPSAFLGMAPGPCLLLTHSDRFASCAVAPACSSMAWHLPWTVKPPGGGVVSCYGRFT